VDDLPALVWCVNTASLEMHPFLHRVPDIERPAAIVFDLDPGEGAGIPECAEVAFLLKEKLAEGGLECFAKVSGSKGMQVYAPLNTAVTYAETRPFVKSLAEELEREHSGAIISSMAKARRDAQSAYRLEPELGFQNHSCRVFPAREKREAVCFVAGNMGGAGSGARRTKRQKPVFRAGSRP
jgi:hypothetical protein